MNSVQIKNKWLEIPIIQGGMGVGVSLSNLAGNVMKNGGMGVLSMAHPGYLEPDFNERNIEANLNAFGKEVKKARALSDGRGLLGVNIMAAIRNFETYVKKAVECAVDAIIVGAGLPLDLPKYVENDTIALAPVVSSGRAAKLLLKAWDRHYSRTADFIVVEGPLAGGHLGFKAKDLEENHCQNLEEIFNDVKKEVAVYEEEYKQKIPIFVAGGVYDGADIARFMKQGANGVQMATRFIATEECDAAPNFKQVILEAEKEDIVFIKSPVGFPGRAVKTALIKRLEQGRIPPKTCMNCLTPCKPTEAPYCITQALVSAVKGDVENGLFFCGENAYRMKEIVSVKTLMESYVNEANQILEV
ncbi:MAG: nitronate monooxygenase family protein [Eubacterium sp.]